MKWVTLAVATAVAVSSVGSAIAGNPSLEIIEPTAHSVQLAQSFGNTSVNADDFLLVSVPGGTLQPHRLYIIEQLQPSPACWEELNPGGGRPTEINDLWNQFDFSGVCRLQRDSNGFATWIGGQDLGLQYSLRVVESGGELVLQTRPSQGTTLTIGRTGGISNTGFARIYLDPGWYLTKRTFNGQIVSSNLVYLTNDATIAQLEAAETDQVAVSPTPTPTPTPTPIPPATPAFADIQGDRYANLISRAAELGITSGYEDGTFRPRNSISREEAVTLVMETVSRTAATSVIAGLPQQVFSDPFPDVVSSRWSALRIQQAKDLEIVSGDFETGAFRPSDPLTRAELIAMARKAQLVISQAAGFQGTTLPPNQTPVAFTDIGGHWAAATITEMSGYCGIASPLNETGTNFAPDSQALRNYAVTTMVRIIDCPARRQGV